MFVVRYITEDGVEATVSFISMPTAKAMAMLDYGRGKPVIIQSPKGVKVVGTGLTSNQ